MNAGCVEFTEGLQQGGCRDQVPADDSPEVFLLYVGSLVRQGQGAQRGAKKRSGEQRRANLVHHQAKIEDALSGAAVLFRRWHSEPTHLRELLPELWREPPLVLFHVADERQRRFPL